MTHKTFFFFAWEFPARGFVDNVDNVDARFKLVPDEVSSLRYTYSYIYMMFNLLSFFYCPHCPQTFQDRVVVTFSCGQCYGQNLVHFTSTRCPQT